MGWREDVKERFSTKKDAARWDEMYSQGTESLADENFRLRRDFTIKYLCDNHGRSHVVCDLGCGAGPVVSELLTLGYPAVGVDYSYDMLENATRRLESLGITSWPLVNGEGAHLPFEDGCFDVVVCLGVISYVENYDDMVKEIDRILKPGGTAIISYRSKYNLMANDPVALGKSVLDSLLRGLKVKEKEKFRIGRYMRMREVLATADAAGLTFCSFKGIGFGPYSFFGMRLFSEERSIRISRFIDHWAGTLKWNFLFRNCTDVNILVFKK